MRKHIQRQVYNVLSSRRALMFCLVAIVITLNSAFQFGESLVEWSRSSYLNTFASFSDNIVQTSFQERMCLPIPIDIVYTWVNGSDPKLIEELAEYKAYLDSLNQTSMYLEQPESSPSPTSRFRKLHSLSDKGQEAIENPESGNEEGKTGKLNPTNSTTNITQSEMPKDEIKDQFSMSRFSDHNELLYSLRSIERYAPWVRKIFIVTNGQIPNWLNVNHPRIQIITHEMIFPNKSHLPSFSSPAIEAHLHRIPGISQKFIYLNDDVMFGKPVWPDDFYTHSEGQKVYLSWPVPNCAEGCPSGWLGDGYCDKACNNSNCGYDNGDCLGKNGTTPTNTYSSTYSGRTSSQTRYCSTGCPESWLGDRYCDKACNNINCAFDSGDCGFDEVYSNLNGFNVTNDDKFTNFTLPNGTVAAYFNLTDVIGSYTIEEGSHDNSVLVRSATFSKKNKVLIATFHRNQTLQDVQFTLTIKINDTLTHFIFGAQVETLPIEFQNENLTETENPRTPTKIKLTADDSTRPTYSYNSYSNYQTNEPKVDLVSKTLGNNTYRALNNLTQLSDEIINQILVLEKELSDAEITQKGYKKKTEKLLEQAKPTAVFMIDPEDILQDPSIQELLNSENLTQLIHEINNIQEQHNQNQNQNQLEQQEQINEQTQIGEGEILTEINTADEDATNSEIEGNNPSEGDNGESSNDQIIVGDEKGDEVISQEIELNLTPGNEIDENTETLEIDNTNEDSITNQNSNEESNQGRNLLSFEFEKNMDHEDETIEQLDFYYQSISNSNEDEKLDEKQISGTSWSEYRTHLDRLASNSQSELKENVNSPEKFHSALLNKISKTSYQTSSRKLLLDTFGESLRYVNMLYNSKFGPAARKVPSHMPHMIDVKAMTELQEMFPDQFEETSSHKLRDGRDMQFSFSYFYYIMSAPKEWDAEQFFSEIDTDFDDFLNPNEIRSLAARLIPVPFVGDSLFNFYEKIYNCSSPDDVEKEGISLENLFSCEEIKPLFQTSMKNQLQYKFQLVDEKEIDFHMIRTNHTTVQNILDGMRKQRKKFVCLNDNIDHTKEEESKLVILALNELYDAYFPLKSSFELPDGVQNEYLYYDELMEYQYRMKIRNLMIWATIGLGVLVLSSRCVFRKLKTPFGLNSRRANAQRFL